MNIKNDNKQESNLPISDVIPCCLNCKHWIYTQSSDDGLCLKLQELIKVECYNGGGVDYITTQKNFLCPNYN